MKLGIPDVPDRSWLQPYLERLAELAKPGEPILVSDWPIVKAACAIVTDMSDLRAAAERLDIGKLVTAIVQDLMTNRYGEQARWLKLTTEDGRNLGGWSALAHRHDFSSVVPMVRPADTVGQFQYRPVLASDPIGEVPMSLDIDELEKAGKAAPSEPWFAAEGSGFNVRQRDTRSGMSHSLCQVRAFDKHREIADFIVLARNNWQEMIEALRENVRLREALEHYADADNWYDVETHDARLGKLVCFSHGRDASDAGKVARDALGT